MYTVVVVTGQSHTGYSVFLINGVYTQIRCRPKYRNEFEHKANLIRIWDVTLCKAITSPPVLTTVVGMSEG